MSFRRLKLRRLRVIAVSSAASLLIKACLIWSKCRDVPVARCILSDSWLSFCFNSKYTYTVWGNIDVCIVYRKYLAVSQGAFHGVKKRQTTWLRKQATVFQTWHQQPTEMGKKRATFCGRDNSFLTRFCFRCDSNIFPNQTGERNVNDRQCDLGGLS